MQIECKWYKNMQLCPNCNIKKRCEEENSLEKLSVYCIEGCFHKEKK